MPYIGTAPASELANLDINGQSLILDADSDTHITADTDDQIDIHISGADDFQFTANKFLVQTGSSIDINGTELILDANGNTSITADTDDQIDIRIAGADDFQFTANTFTASSGSSIVQTDGKMFLGDTANGGLTQGLTINSGANDDETFVLKSSDVGHAMTGIAEADTYMYFKKLSAGNGGVYFAGFSEGAQALRLIPFITGSVTTKSSSATSACEVYPVKSDGGSSIEALGSNENCFAVWGTSGHTQFIVDSDGDVHYDGSTNAGAWDDYDDIELLNSFRSLTIKDKNAAKNIFGDFVDEHAKVLNDTGVITWNEDGHHFVSTKGLNGLLIDSIRQTNARMKTIVNTVEEIIPGFGTKLNERLAEQKLPSLPVSA
jgi:hypothetical protein